MSERGPFTRCNVCTSLIRQDLDFVTVIKFKLHILNKTLHYNIDLKPQSRSLYFDYLLIQIRSFQKTSPYPKTMPGTCPLEICWPKGHLIMKLKNNCRQNVLGFKRNLVYIQSSSFNYKLFQKYQI